MAYSKTTWATGDVIDAAKLNNLEDGVAANDTAICGLVPFEIAATTGEDAGHNPTATLDCKASELYSAVNEGRLVAVTVDYGEISVRCVTSMYVAEGTPSGGGVHAYDFALTIYTDGSPMLFVAYGMAANDTVVMTERAN